MNLRKLPLVGSGCRCLLYTVLLLPAVAAAQWNIVTHQTAESEPQTKVAQTINEAGYTLEIYRDAGDTIRSRLTLTDGLIQLTDKSCPTFQIDKGKARNRSINDAPCISRSQWAEFILGQVKNDKVESPILLSLMNGINISFRFVLANGDYRETQFSLAGSKWAMTSVFGQNVTVTASQ